MYHFLYFKDNLKDKYDIFATRTVSITTAMELVTILTIILTIALLTVTGETGYIIYLRKRMQSTASGINQQNDSQKEIISESSRTGTDPDHITEDDTAACGETERVTDETPADSIPAPVVKEKGKTVKAIDYRFDELTMTDGSDKLVGKVIDVIRKNIDNSDFSVEDLSREIGISRVHLNRKLKELMNISPSNLIKSIRLKQAAFLLINNKVNISEVAYKVGFSTHSYFSNSFHDYFGMTPKEFVSRYIDCKDEDTLKRIFQ